MSADNWEMCPVCRTKALRDFEDRVINAQSKYGKIDQDEFLKLWDSVCKSKPREGFEVTKCLAENCEIGINVAGEFFVSYSAHCEVCDFNYKFKHSKMVVDPE